ncbi:WXG100 family type VII secretion target [bacterium]|nr:WXG100 family type VII secretion target [bacterium]
MSILHMETDVVRQVSAKLKEMSDLLQSQADAVYSRVESIDWRGGSRDEFVSEIAQIRSALVSYAEICDVLRVRLEAEIVQWEETAAKFDGGGSSISTGSMNPVNTLPATLTPVQSLELELLDSRLEAARLELYYAEREMNFDLDVYQLAVEDLMGTSYVEDYMMLQDFLASHGVVDQAQKNVWSIFLLSGYRTGGAAIDDISGGIATVLSAISKDLQGQDLSGMDYFDVASVFAENVGELVSPENAGGALENFFRFITASREAVDLGAVVGNFILSKNFQKEFQQSWAVYEEAMSNYYSVMDERNAFLAGIQ